MPPTNDNKKNTARQKIYLSISKDLLDKIDSFAESNQLSRAEAMRFCVNLGLAHYNDQPVQKSGD